MVGEYKMQEQEGKTFLVNDDRTLKLNYKKRANLKASPLFLTTSRNTYISSIYPIDDIIQSVKINMLDGDYTLDFNKVKYFLSVKDNLCIINRQKKG